MLNRRQPFGASGALAALLIGGRDFNFTCCESCRRKLYFTYLGEECPFCDAVVGMFVAGVLPKVTTRTCQRAVTSAGRARKTAACSGASRSFGVA